MSFCKQSLACAALFLVLGLTTIAQAGIMNGGFESPDITDGRYAKYLGGSTAITGWKVVGSDVLLIDKTYAEAGITFNSFSGRQSLDLTGAGNTGLLDGVQQSIATIIGQQYALSFYVGRGDNGGVNTSYGTSSKVDLSFDGGTTRSSFTNSDKTANKINWKQFTTYFTATALSTSITFLNGTALVSAGGNNFAGLDEVRLQAVPEPSSIAIFGLIGLAAGAGRMRRRLKR